MSQAKYKKLYDAQADNHRRKWLQQRGRGETVRLTSRQGSELKKWFQYWDRDQSGTVNPRTIADALFSLNVLSGEQKEELDALVDAVTHGDDAKFKFDEFRTLMTYPKCGIAKTVLGVLESDLFGDESQMPFHLLVQAHKREKLIGGLMSRNAAMKKESERVLGVYEAQMFRKQKLAQLEEQQREEAVLEQAAQAKQLAREETMAQRAAAGSKASMASRMSKVTKASSAGEADAPTKGWGKVRSTMAPSQASRHEPASKMSSLAKSVMGGRMDGPNSATPIHSKILFKTTAVNNKLMQFRPSDFFPPMKADSPQPDYLY